MQRTKLDVAAKVGSSGDEGTATVTLTNKSNRIAFFVRLELTKGIDGDEVLPSTYEDNYIIRRIRARDVLGGLHHEYWLEEIAA